jgi:metal-responsive CopG/Arc/MetJ family transcriptional regulator
MGKSISIYLDDDLIEWLDELREPFDMSRSQVISTTLRMAKDVREKFFDFQSTLTSVGDMFSTLSERKKEKEKRKEKRSKTR